MALGTIAATGVGISKTLGFDPIDSLSSLFGGGNNCPGNINEMRTELAGQIDRLLSSSEKRELVRGMESNVAATGASMARFFYGGRDCKHKNVSPGDQQFLDKLPVVLTEAARAKQQQQQAGSLNPGQPTQAGAVPGGLNLPMILIAAASAFVIFQVANQ